MSYDIVPGVAGKVREVSGAVTGNNRLSATEVPNDKLSGDA